MIDQTEEIEACLQAFSKYWKSGTFFTPCSQRSHVGTSTETSSNLLPKVQILTCSFFCMKDWRFSFVRVDSNLEQLQINIDISRPIFSALKPVKSAILYPRPYLNQDIQKYFFFTDRCDDMCSKRKTSLHSHAKRGTDQNRLLKSCSHMGTLGGKRLTNRKRGIWFSQNERRRADLKKPWSVFPQICSRTDFSQISTPVFLSYGPADGQTRSPLFAWKLVKNETILARFCKNCVTLWYLRGWKSAKKSPEFQRFQLSWKRSFAETSFCFPTSETVN